MTRSYNLVRETTPEKGGHFPFLETPNPFANDIATFFASIPFS
jgi:pimeloyl-ACP methyl ester carboxylesterase